MNVEVTEFTARNDFSPDTYVRQIFGPSEDEQGRVTDQMRETAGGIQCGRPSPVFVSQAGDEPRRIGTDELFAALNIGAADRVCLWPGGEDSEGYRRFTLESREVCGTRDGVLTTQVLSQVAGRACPTVAAMLQQQIMNFRNELRQEISDEEIFPSEEL